jgi:uncharacterized protein with FMN-binding domain
MSPLNTRSAIAAFAVLSASTLAGCAATGAGGDASTTAESADYADGTYTESGEYQAPSGTETVEVTVTLADNVVTDVTVVGDATDPQARLMQGQFIEGIAGIVVGRNIDELQVDKVGGSSLTSGGFNAALEKIKDDAAA